MPAEATDQGGRSAESASWPLCRLLLPADRRPLRCKNRRLLPAAKPGQHGAEIALVSLGLFAVVSLALWELLRPAGWGPGSAGSLALLLPSALLAYGALYLGTTVLAHAVSLAARAGLLQARRVPAAIQLATHGAVAGTAAAMALGGSAPAVWIAVLWLTWLGLNALAFLLQRSPRGPLLAALLLHLPPLALGWTAGWIAGLAALFLAHMLLLAATLLPAARWNGPVLRSFATGEREVWLTIDDGPEEDTEAILAVLARHRAAATFFLIGRKVAASPGLAHRIAAAGHQIAHHTHSHPAGSFWAAGPARTARELDEGLEALRAAGSPRPTLFRAPAGFRNVFLWPALARRGLHLAGWSHRGYDGVPGDETAMLQRLTRRLRPGSILLLHQGRPWSVSLLDSLLHRLEEEGYRCVLPEVMADGRAFAISACAPDEARSGNGNRAP